jgi:hypothetical protein
MESKSMVYNTLMLFDTSHAFKFVHIVEFEFPSHCLVLGKVTSNAGQDRRRQLELLMAK